MSLLVFLHRYNNNLAVSFISTVCNPCTSKSQMYSLASFKSCPKWKPAQANTCGNTLILPIFSAHQKYKQFRQHLDKSISWSRGFTETSITPWVTSAAIWDIYEIHGRTMWKTPAMCWQWSYIPGGWLLQLYSCNANYPLKMPASTNNFPF